MANQQIGVEVVAVGIAAFSRAMRTAQDDLERTSNSINKAAGITQGFGKSLTDLGGNMQRVGRAMLIDVTAPLGILTGALINAGVQFEDAFAGIGKTVGGVSVGFQEIKDAAERELGITITTMDEARQAAEQMGMAFGDLTDVGMEVRNEFRQMALDIPMSATELAELGEIVGQLGVEAPQIGEVTKQVAELGLTTNMSAEDAAMSLIRMANIMRSTVGPDAISMTEFIKRAGSALVDLGNKSVATESEIMNFALRLSAAGDMANMSEQDVLAWATTLADLGARAESGGTAVSRALENMIIAVQSGSKELSLFASVAGMSAQEFQKAFRDDASGALAMFTQKLKEAFEAGKINKDMLTDMGLGGIRAFDILGRLGNAQEILAKNTANANKAWAEAVALEEEAEKRFGTFKNQLQILKNTFMDLGISIFDLVEGDLKVLVGWIKDAINWFKGLDDSVKKNIVIMAAIAAVIGPLLIIFGGLISMLGAVATGITALGAAAIPVIAILGSLLAAAGLAAGVNLFGSTKTPTAAGAPITPTANPKIAQETPSPAAPGATSRGPLSPIEQGWLDFLKLIQVDLPKAIADIQVKLQPFFDMLRGIVSEDLADAWDSLNEAWANLSISAGPLIDALKQIIPIIGVALIAVLTLAILFVANVIRSFAAAAENIGTIVSGLGTMLGGIISFVSGIWNVFSGVINLIVGAFAYLVAFIQGDTEKMSQIFNDVMLPSLDTIVKGAEQIFGGLVDIFKGIFTTITGLVTAFWDQTVTFFSGMWDDVVKIFQSLSDDLIGHSIITDMLADILQAFINTKDTILSIIGELVLGVIQAFANVGTTIAGGIQSALGVNQQPAGGTEGQPAGGGGAGPISVQQIAALQQAILALQDIWIGFDAVVTTTLTNISQTFMLLTQFTASIFSNMAISFTSLFINPITQAIIEFAASAFPLFTILSEEWRVICLGMVKSWLDFTANAAKLTPGFVDGVIGEFTRLRNNASGQISLLTSQFVEDFGAGGDAPLAIEQFGDQLMGLEPKFSKLVSAVNKFIGQVNSKLKSICPAMAVAIACITGSPELKLQHPFELFEDYLKGVDYGKLITKATVMPQLQNVMSVIPNTQGNITNIDKSISSSITGLPIDTAENVADTMLRQIRMGEVLQG